LILERISQATRRRAARKRIKEGVNGNFVSRIYTGYFQSKKARESAFRGRFKEKKKIGKTPEITAAPEGRSRKKSGEGGVVKHFALPSSNR